MKMMKTVLLVRPRDGKAPPMWPDEVVVQLQRHRNGNSWMYIVTGFSTIIEYTSKTVIPLDRDLILDLMTQWHRLYKRGSWDFYLKPEGHQPALFKPRRKRLYFIPEQP
jgi:hypothetical protein